MDHFALLKKYGIPIPKYEIVNSENSLLKAYNKIKPPVVLKVWDKRYSHKTDIGGVILDIWSKEVLLNSYKHLKKRFNPSSFLIQKQIKKGIELFAGIKKDEVFGSLLVFGLGGIYVEVFKDITARILPISEEDFDDMLEELKSKKILLGYRGKKLTIKKLRDVVLKLSKLYIKENIKEIDLNPIKVDEKNCYVLDIRIER